MRLKDIPKEWKQEGEYYIVPVTCAIRKGSKWEHLSKDMKVKSTTVLKNNITRDLVMMCLKNILRKELK
jgi:hypothetical protein